MKKWYKSTTVWVGSITSLWALLPLIIELLNYVGMFDFESDQPTNWYLFAAGIVMIIQRWRTDAPINSINPVLDKLRPRIKANDEANRYRKV